MCVCVQVCPRGHAGGHRQIHMHTGAHTRTNTRTHARANAQGHTHAHTHDTEIKPRSSLVSGISLNSLPARLSCEILVCTGVDEDTRVGHMSRHVCRVQSSKTSIPSDSRRPILPHPSASRKPRSKPEDYVILLCVRPTRGLGFKTNTWLRVCLRVSVMQRDGKGWGGACERGYTFASCLACNSNSNFKECLDQVGANPRFTSHHARVIMLALAWHASVTMVTIASSE
jgi:hypothetical protein